MTPGFVVERDEPGMPAIVDLVERIASVHDCEVIALRHPPARPPYRVAGARVTALGVGTASGASGRARVLAGGVRAVLRRHRRRPFDLVHALWADEAGAVATIAGRLVRRPVVVSVLGGELARIPDIGYGAALGRGGRWTVGVSFRGADLVTAGSSTALAAILERRPERPVALLPLGVDTTVFRPADAAEAETADAERAGRPARQTILFAGSLEPVKDPAAMLRVFGRLASDRPGLDLVLVGDGRLRAGAGDVDRRDRAGRTGPVRRSAPARRDAGALSVGDGARRDLPARGPVDGRRRGRRVGRARRREPGSGSCRTSATGRRPCPSGTRRASPMPWRPCSTIPAGQPGWPLPDGPSPSPGSTSNGRPPTSSSATPAWSSRDGGRGRRP